MAHQIKSLIDFTNDFILQGPRGRELPPDAVDEVNRLATAARRVPLRGRATLAELTRLVSDWVFAGTGHENVQAAWRAAMKTGTLTAEVEHRLTSASINAHSHLAGVLNRLHTLMLQLEDSSEDPTAPIRTARAAERMTVDSTAGKRKKPKGSRLTVNVRQQTITLDGTAYEVSSEQAVRWVRCLVARAGQLVSSKELEELDPDLVEVRTDRLGKYLPSPVREIIESKSGKGSRIRLAPVVRKLT